MNKPEYSGTFEIVGITKEANYTDPSGHWRRPLFFVPLAQHSHYNFPMMQMIDDRTHLIESACWFAVEWKHGGHRAANRRVFREVDPNFTILDIHTMEEQVAKPARPASAPSPR